MEHRECHRSEASIKTINPNTLPPLRSIFSGVFLLATLLLVPAFVYGSVDADFEIAIKGARSVVRGYPLHLSIEPRLISGTDDTMVTPTVEGLPKGATIRWVTLELACCGTKMYRLSGAYHLKVSIPASTSPGPYSMDVILTTDDGVTRKVTYNFTVLSAYAFSQRRRTFAPDTPLPYLSQWESNMVHYGLHNCQQSTGTWDGFAWYYDGIRVYYNISDYTKNATFDACARHELDVYRSYVITYSGGIPRYRFFAEGLMMDYQRSGEDLSRQAVSMLNGHTGANSAWYVDAEFTRELSYELEVQLIDSRLSGVTHPMIQDRVEILIGHFDQWFISKTNRPQPFMVGLAAEALIRYYESSNDPRIPGLIQIACDGLWGSHWDGAVQGFQYYHSDGSSSVEPNLNLLIVPMFGWTYRNTADPKYRERGDLIFAGGVTRAWLARGKEFSQNYRWSFKYIEWRTPPPALMQRSPKR